MHDALPDVYAWYIHGGMTGFPEILAHCVGFQWDEGNADKNWELHHVSRAEAEEMFFNRPLVVASDDKHSEKEIRLAALGKTDADRLLAIVFTVRENLVRVISARDMSRRERSLYEQAS
ncbi:MAG TPA: BrnT family toxin [Polyangia bacterium]|nr:BrnT family toxin [Polyangia bacterium]